jgi:hypothetical protein
MGVGSAYTATVEYMAVLSSGEDIALEYPGKQKFGIPFELLTT